MGRGRRHGLVQEQDRPRFRRLALRTAGVLEHDARAGRGRLSLHPLGRADDAGGGMSRLTGKTALITGAARGLGAAYVRRFVAEGARVLVTDVIDEEGRSLAEEMGADAADLLRLDVSCGESRGAAVRRCVRRLGRSAQWGKMDVGGEV